MSNGKTKEAWGHTSNLMAMIANVNRDHKKRSKPYSAEDFNPMMEKKRKAIATPAPLTVLRDIFVR